jgi:hypothetical protein
LLFAIYLKITQIFVIFSELQEDKTKERTKDKVVSEDENSLSTSSSDEEFNDGFDENLFAGEEDRKMYVQYHKEREKMCVCVCVCVCVRVYVCTCERQTNFFPFVGTTV